MISLWIARWGAVGAIFAGLTWVFMGAVAIVFAETAPADPTGTLYFYLFEGAGTIGGVGAIAALVGFHARQTPDYGRLGTAGFLIAFVGAIGGGFAGVLWLVCLNGCSSPVFTVIWDLSLLCDLLGSSMLGVATFRTGILPRWSGLLLIAKFPLVGVAALFDGNGGMMLLLLALVGLLWLALGYALWPKREASTEGLPLARA